MLLHVAERSSTPKTFGDDDFPVRTSIESIFADLRLCGRLTLCDEADSLILSCLIRKAFLAARERSSLSAGELRRLVRSIGERERPNTSLPIARVELPAKFTELFELIEKLRRFSEKDLFRFSSRSSQCRSRKFWRRFANRSSVNWPNARSERKSRRTIFAR